MKCLEFLLQDAKALSKAGLAGYQPPGGEQQASYGKHKDEHQYTDVDKSGLQWAQNDLGKWGNTGELEECIVASDGVSGAE
ncbi:MAG: hypothetical protein JXR84_18545 [Anaerolineae bacterium]|nr:hypothetical protein [Anaerolineae bacterium]